MSYPIQLINTIQSVRNSLSRPPLRRGLPRKQQLPRTQARWIIRGCLFIPLALALAWFALSPVARAVDPPPDGGYPNQNTAEGEDALFSVSFGLGGNTAIGFQALYSDTGGHYNTASGSQALFSNTTGYGNTAIGFNALMSNTTGFANTANGYKALVSNTTGFLNTAVGNNALYLNTTGVNTAIGAGALFHNTTGSDNTANGTNALEENTTGDSNTANGFDALFANTTGNGNTANGVGALNLNTIGINNTAIGITALSDNTIGGSNIALGVSAGANLTTGSNNIDIGNAGVANESNNIRIGTKGTQTATFIAGISGATVTGRAVVVNNSGQLGIAPSSKRFKDKIQPMDKASEAILALQPVTFRYKHELDPDGIPQFGLVAEQVEKVNPDLVARDDQGKPYTVRYEAVNAMLLNEFLKEHRKVEEQEATITQVKATVAKQAAIIAQQQKDFQAIAAHQQKQIETLTAGLQKVSAQVEMSKPASQMVLNNQ
jgi:hypothetical protein